MPSSSMKRQSQPTIYLKTKMILPFRRVGRPCLSPPAVHTGHPRDKSGRAGYQAAGHIVPDLPIEAELYAA